MTTRAQYQRNAARRGLHQMSSENETPEALSFSPLKRLELETVELVRSIEAREHRMQQDKRQVLFNINLSFKWSCHVLFSEMFFRLSLILDCWSWCYSIYPYFWG